MPIKTVHVIAVHSRSSLVVERLLELLHAFQGSFTVTVTERNAGRTDVEVVLPDPSRVQAANLARRISQEFPSDTVNAHYRVNAMWFLLESRLKVTPGPRVIGSVTATVLYVNSTVRSLLALLEQHPAQSAGLAVHAQAWGDAAQIVLPGSTSNADIDRLIRLLEDHGKSVRAERDVRGYWMANGSRHHDFSRFQNGNVRPFTSNYVWSE